MEVKGPQVASVQEPQAVCQEGSPGMQQGQQKLPTIGELVTEQLSLSDVLVSQQAHDCTDIQNCRSVHTKTYRGRYI